LLLDRYQREAKKIKSVLRHDYFDTVNRELTGSADLPQQLVELVDDEIKSARCVLSTLNEEDELTRFNTAVAQCPEDKIGTKFVEMRGLIAKSLLQVPRDRYVLTHSSSASASPSDIVKQMVEHSSQRLTMILPKS
jgi:hypothetical protein